MKLKNKVMSSITALAAAMVMMAGMTIPAYANIDQAAADAAEAEGETETVIEETQPEPDEETPFSSPGNGDLGDEIKSSSKKDFYTIRTQNNNVFYLVIDHAGNTDNVYMLSLVDENDLAEFMDEKPTQQQQTPAVVIPEETRPAQETEPAPAEPEEPTQTNNSGSLMVILLIVLAGAGGAYYYLKVYKPKKEEETWESEHMETDDGLDTINEDEESE